MGIHQIFKEFKKFNIHVFKSFPPANVIEIIKLEEKIMLKLPQDFKDFLMLTNGAIIDCHTLYGINPNKLGIDLYDNYIFETIKAGNPMKKYYMPILPDGMGNHNCLDLNTLDEEEETCNIIFWQHDKIYNNNIKPDIDAYTFTEFLSNKFKEIFELYNFDGSDKCG